MARALQTTAIGGRHRTTSVAREAVDRMTCVLRLLHLIPCDHRHAYIAGTIRICEMCGNVWRQQAQPIKPIHLARRSR
jgi:hypothetical protein